MAIVELYKIEVWLKSDAGYEFSPAIGFSKERQLPVKDGFVFFSDLRKLNGFGFPLDSVHHYKITAVFRESDNATTNPPSMP